MPARRSLSARLSRPCSGSGGLALAVVLAIVLSGCRPPSPAEGMVEPSASFSRPVATLGPDDAVPRGTDGAATASAPVEPASAGQMKRALDAAGKVALHVDFDTDGTNLRADAAPVLDEIVALLRDNPTLKLSIDAHANAAGSAERNRTLAQQRAETVRAALIANGIDADRLRARGLGADRPVTDSGNPDSRSNRRVELVRLD